MSEDKFQLGCYRTIQAMKEQSINLSINSNSYTSFPQRERFICTLDIWEIDY